MGDGSGEAEVRGGTLEEFNPDEGVLASNFDGGYANGGGTNGAARGEGLGNVDAVGLGGVVF